MQSIQQAIPLFRILILDFRFLTIFYNLLVATAKFQDSPLPSKVPSTTSRTLESDYTQIFTLSNSQDALLDQTPFLSMFLQHLQHFQLFQFHFAVTANEFRLLNNFSVSITAQALTQAYIIRDPK